MGFRLAAVRSEGDGGCFGRAGRFVGKGNVVKGRPVFAGWRRAFSRRYGCGSGRCGTGTAVGKAQLARQGVKRVLFALRCVHQRQAYPFGDQRLLQQRAFVLDELVLLLQHVEQGNGIADGVAHQRVGGKVFFDDAVEQLFVLPGKFAQRLVTDGAPGAFQGVEGAADVGGELRVGGIFVPLRVGVVHGGDDFAQFFVEELADFFVHDCIGMAADEARLLGGDVEFFQIGEGFVREIGNAHHGTLPAKCCGIAGRSDGNGGGFFAGIGVVCVRVQLFRSGSCRSFAVVCCSFVCRRSCGFVCRSSCCAMCACTGICGSRSGRGCFICFAGSRFACRDRGFGCGGNCSRI